MRPGAAAGVFAIAVSVSLVSGGGRVGRADPGGGGRDHWMQAREEMVRGQIEARGVRDPRVLAAMRAVPRHRFVPTDQRDHAYEDQPLPIGLRQTISQPYIVAVMTELLRPEPTDRVLEVGTGSGYQAAVLAHVVSHVYTIEILPELADRAAKTLAELGYDNVTVSTGDGYRGVPEQAPFDGILVTAAPAEIPQPLIDQLAPGGRLVIPVGGYFQELKVLEKTQDGLRTRSEFPVRFVPMTGEAQR
ncbi:MAG: protein-L-isoaspartate(D-aspartate) O-methyltransferase [Myxococcota bacterium]